MTDLGFNMFKPRLLRFCLQLHYDGSQKACNGGAITEKRGLFHDIAVNGLSKPPGSEHIWFSVTVCSGQTAVISVPEYISEYDIYQLLVPVLKKIIN